MQKAIIISGPTASGKTDLAYTIAHNTSVVLLNADSRHVYKGLNIIAGKDLPSDAKYNPQGYYSYLNTQLYLFDVVNVTQDFNVNEYAKAARTVIESLSDTVVPVFVGGSNFYISVLRDEIETVNIPPDRKLRNTLAGLSVRELQNRLHEYDPRKLSGMNESDRKNPRRLIRAIEVALFKRDNTVQTTSVVLDTYSVLHLGLTAPLEYIRQKINSRVDARLAQGAQEEAQALFKKFGSLSSNVKTANGYKQFFDYFQGNISFGQAIKEWKFSEYHNAKKQLTWIHGDSRIKKYSITDVHYPDTVLQDILSFIQE